MQRKFEGIASSIHDSTRHLTVRAVYVVNDDLIREIEELDRLKNTNGNIWLMAAYKETISDLEKERAQSSSIYDELYCNLTGIKLVRRQ